MKIIFFGTPKEVVPILENLTKCFDVAAVVSTPDQKAGRKLLLAPSPVKTSAQKQNLPVITPQQFTKKTIEQLQTFKPDIFVVAAYGKIVPAEIIDIPQYGSINIHPSLLPKYRGPTPIQATLLNGDQTSGITFMKMDAKMDHGPILHQIPFTLEKTDTFDWLMQSKFAQAAQILPHVIDEYIAGKIEPQAQDEAQATYTKIITKEDGYIDLNNPPNPDQLDRMIRAYYPWPSAWTKATLNNYGIRIKFLPEKKLQVEGKKPVEIKDFLNGYPEMKAILTEILK